MDTMDFKDALRSIIKPHNEDPLGRLTTPFGEALSKDKVLTEYPRPQFERPSYINLNGLWDYAIQPKKGFPDRYDPNELLAQNGMTVENMAAEAVRLLNE